MAVALAVKKLEVGKFEVIKIRGKNKVSKMNVKNEAVKFCLMFE